MPKVAIDYDERFPDFTVETCPLPGDTTVQVSQRILDRWLRTVKEYNKVQDEMKAYRKNSGGSIPDE